MAYIEALLTRAEVAARFRVDPKTVTRWANAGKLDCVFTPGGHRRYRASAVRALLAAPGPLPAAEPDPLSASVGSLWPAVTRGPVAALQKRLEAAGVATVRELAGRTARELEADVRLRPAQVEAVRLALYRAGLALRGDVLEKPAA